MKVCHVVYAFYETDTRVRMYAEALSERGDHVDVISLRKEGQARCEVVEGVHVNRIQPRVINERNKATYLFRLIKFFMKSSAFLAKSTLNGDGRYDLIHIHSVPDFEVFAALIPKLYGSKIILDIHDIVPEFYASKFSVSESSLIFKGLVLTERASTAFADYVIVANHLWERTLTERSVKKEKCSTFLNYPIPAFFRAYPKNRDDGKVVLVYPGSLNWHQGVDIAIRAFDRIKARVPEAEFHIYGSGAAVGFLRKLVDERNLNDRVFIREFLPLDEIVPLMASADIGVVPKRADSFGDQAFSTKIFEFMALGVPVIVSRTQIDSFYFDDSVVKFFDSKDEESLAEAMLELIRNRQLRTMLSRNAAAYIQCHSWSCKKEDYTRLVDEIATSGMCGRAPGSQSDSTHRVSSGRL
jgi:glycosyltransferase involved in cell wall biosynthesis